MYLWPSTVGLHTYIRMHYISAVGQVHSPCAYTYMQQQPFLPAVKAIYILFTSITYSSTTIASPFTIHSLLFTTLTCVCVYVCTYVDQYTPLRNAIMTGCTQNCIFDTTVIWILIHRATKSMSSHWESNTWLKLAVMAHLHARKLKKYIYAHVEL